jgi:hypothetical protein
LSIPRFPDQAFHRAEQVAQQDRDGRDRRCGPDPVRGGGGSFTLADAKVLSLFKPGIPTLLIANKLDTVGRRAEIAPWLRDMQERHPFAEFVPMSAKNKRISSACMASAPNTCRSSPGSTARTN